MLRRWLALLPLVLAAGCTMQGPVESRVDVAASGQPGTSAVASAATSPSVAAAPTLPQPTATPQATPTSTPQASPTPEPTPEPVETDDAAAQAVRDNLGYCRRAWGAGAEASWSGRLDSVTAGVTAGVAELRLEFADLEGELHGVASCAPAAAWPAGVDIGATAAPGPAMILVELPDWAHDDLFRASSITETIDVGEISGVEGVAFAASSLDSRGAVLGIGLSEPRPFDVRVDGSALVVEFASEAALSAADDPLGVQTEAAEERPSPAEPVYFLEGGDIFVLENGSSRNITNSPEPETDLAVSPDGSLLAVCRAPANSERFQLPYDVRAALWTLAADGSNAQLLADVGGCAEPRFDPAGQRIAFTVNVAPSPPARLEIWTVGLDGQPSAAASGVDDWNRSHPRWLPDGRLVYLADDGTSSTLMLRGDDGETELTASLLSGPAYVGVGAFLVDDVSGEVAIEALREAGGADLVVLGPDGARMSSERRGFYQRPLDFHDGELVYLSTDCPGDAVLSYTVYRRESGTIETLARGTTQAAIGAATLTGDALVYARHPSAPAGLRGPVALAPDEPGTLWALALGGGAQRAELLAADGPIDTVVTRR